MLHASVGSMSERVLLCLLCSPFFLFERDWPQGTHPHVQSSPAPTIHGATGIRSIVGAREAGMRRGGPLWSPVRCLHPPLYLKCIGHKGPHSTQLRPAPTRTIVALKKLTPANGGTPFIRQCDK